MISRALALIGLLSPPVLVSAQTVDCSDAYNGKPSQVERRNVTITLRVGPKGQAYFDGIVGYGFHVSQQ
jgi:hypothetical protein